MKTYDVHVEDFIPIVSPAALKAEMPVSDTSAATVLAGRRTIERIISRQDPRLLVVVGPCSIHDETAALDYAHRVRELSDEVADTIFLVMRVYFEKPRTTVGWKGLISDPCLDGSCDMDLGLRRARQLLREITDLGLATGTEMLDPITPQYIAGLVCWAAIGARTTESQTHREMASGLSMPVGFKNGTEGDLQTALDAMIATRAPQHFLGIDPDGRNSIVKTTGNPNTHIVLRGGRRPNYDSVSVREAGRLLAAKGLPEAVMIDCSHANSRKRFEEQTVVWNDIIHQRVNGNAAIIGAMLESNLEEGRQDYTGCRDTLRYGVSITDACISWGTTEALIRSAHAQLAAAAGIP